MTPFKSKVGQAIYESTVASQASKMIRKTEKTRTMIRVTANALEKQFISNENEDFEISRRRGLITLNQFFYNNDVNYLRSIIHLMVHVASDDIADDLSTCCSYQMAYNFRKKSWQKVIDGITVPYPLSFLNMSILTHGTSPSSDMFPYGYIQILSPIQEGNLLHLTCFLMDTSKSKVPFQRVINTKFSLK